MEDLKHWLNNIRLPRENYIFEGKLQLENILANCNNLAIKPKNTSHVLQVVVGGGVGKPQGKR